MVSPEIRILHCFLASFEFLLQIFVKQLHWTLTWRGRTQFLWKNAVRPAIQVRCCFNNGLHSRTALRCPWNLESTAAGPNAVTIHDNANMLGSRVNQLRGTGGDGIWTYEQPVETWSEENWAANAKSGLLPTQGFCRFKRKFTKPKRAQSIWFLPDFKPHGMTESRKIHWFNSAD